MFFINILLYLIRSNECDGSIRCTFTSQEVTISGTTFSDLSSGSKEGGALYIDNCEVSVFGSTFVNCKSSTKGGAVYCQQSASHTFSVKDCIFEKCTAFDGGGIFYKQSLTSNDEINNCVFKECKATGIGGGVFFESNGGSIVDCEFTSCEAEFNGGSLTYWNVAKQSDSGIVQRCIFDSKLSLYNPNLLYTTTRIVKEAKVQPLKIADCGFYAQENWQNNPGCFLIAAGTGIEFEGTNYMGGDEDSIVWPFSGKVETSSIIYNADSSDKPSVNPSRPSSAPSRPSSAPSRPSSAPSKPASEPSSSSQSTSNSAVITSAPTTNDIHTATQPINNDDNYKSQIEDIKQQTKKLKLISIIFVAAVAVLLLIICPILIYFIVKTVKNGTSKTTMSLHEPMI